MNEFMREMDRESERIVPDRDTVPVPTIGHTKTNRRTTRVALIIGPAEVRGRCKLEDIGGKGVQLSNCRTGLRQRLQNQRNT